MDEGTDELLNSMVNAASLAEFWDSSRKLMRDKDRGSAGIDSRLLESLRRLGEWSSQVSDINRLVAIDLLVRIPASIRKIAREAQHLRQEVLKSPIPALSVIAEKKDLPDGAEPAEVRENVAKALADASGEWVLPYAIRAFAEEDRSQRCRAALSALIAQRNTNIDEWFNRLLREPAIQALPENADRDAAARLRDVALALADTIRTQRYRLQVSAAAGKSLSDLAGVLVPLGPRDSLPKHLTDAACATVSLLDELLAVRLTLMDEAELYQVLERLRRWWSQTRYPAKLTQALSPILDKIVAGIVFRARGGQTSENLMLRLRQAINDENEVRRRLASLASNETGLSPEVQDWLLRIDRKTSSSKIENSRLLTAVAGETFVRTFAPAFLLAEESGTTSGQYAARLADIVLSIGAQFGLAVVGKPGDVVEYSPSAHEHVDGGLPSERRVTLVHPPVIRKRADGGSDIIMRGLVRSA